MRIKYSLNDTDSVEATLNITMPIKEWKQLMGQLQDCWPSWKLGGAISNLITKAERAYTDAGDYS